MTRHLLTLRDAALAAALLGLLLLVALRLDGDEDEKEAVSGPFQVIDGDTLSAGGDRLRLAGIDAPELAQTCTTAEGGAWDCGTAARAALAARVGGMDVTCSGRARDRYHRLLVDCLGKQGSINRQLVADGFAVAFGDYARDEAKARQARRGIWAGAFDRPRDWRSVHGARAQNSPLDEAWNWLAGRFGGVGP